MKRNWEIDELIEQWTLLPDELALLGNKTGATRLGFAISLKLFQQEACFPLNQSDLPFAVLSHIASQVGVAPEEYQKYDWHGRMAMYHRRQIREFFGFRRATVGDAKALVNWLVENVLYRETDSEHLKEIMATNLRRDKSNEKDESESRILVRGILSRTTPRLKSLNQVELNPRNGSTTSRLIF